MARLSADKELLGGDVYLSEEHDTKQSSWLKISLSCTCSVTTPLCLTGAIAGHSPAGFHHQEGLLTVRQFSSPSQCFPTWRRHINILPILTILSQLPHFGWFFLFSFLIKISAPKGKSLVRNLRFHYEKRNVSRPQKCSEKKKNRVWKGKSILKVKKQQEKKRVSSLRNKKWNFIPRLLLFLKVIITFFFPQRGNRRWWSLSHCLGLLILNSTVNLTNKIRLV